MDSRIQLAAVLAIDHLLEIPRSILGCAAGCAKGFVASDTNLAHRLGGFFEVFVQVKS